MKDIYLNGFFLTKKITGVQRFAYNILLELDKLAMTKPSIIVLIPAFTAEIKNKFPNLKFQIYKNKFSCINNNEILWTNLVLAKLPRIYYLVNLCNFAPLVRKNQLVVLHDVIPFRYPQSCSRLWGMYFRLMTKIFVKRVRTLASVSLFSANEIKRITGSSRTIFVLGNSGAHLNIVDFDDTVMSKLTLLPKQYILTVSSQATAYHKNFQILLDLAKKTNMPIVAVGNGTDNLGIQFVRNVSDRELKSLYMNAFVFVFTSFYEGFGIPPLEAMECGTPVIVSNIPVFKEVCSDAALYFDPLDANDLYARIQNLKSDPKLRIALINNGFERVKYYTWTAVTQKILEIIDRCGN